MVCKEGVMEKNKYLRADSAKLLLKEPLSLEKLPHHGLPAGQVPILGEGTGSQRGKPGIREGEIF